MIANTVNATGTVRLREALAAAGIDWDEVADHHALAGGTFNAVTRVTLAAGTRLVVKIPPDPQTPLLSYERGILGTEALFYALADLPVIGSPQAFRGIGFAVGATADSPVAWARAVAQIGAGAFCALPAASAHQHEAEPWDVLAEAIGELANGGAARTSAPLVRM